MDGPYAAKLRALPSVQRLLERPEAQLLAAAHGRAALTDAIRAALVQARQDVRNGAPPSDPLDGAARILCARSAPRIRRVINATGIILHTNLGRAPLAREAIAAMTEIAAGYSTLEYDLASGARGHRTQGVEPLIRQLTGAADALAVNNNAAAMLLAIAGLGADGEVIVSRGELIEIGGGFRIPDVIAQGGAVLREVGTTNKTRLADYEAAITGRTRIILKTHRSNFRVSGFTAEVAVRDLGTLAHEHGLILVHDLGSGLIAPADGVAGEPAVRHSVEAGADVTAFSADKLLGGPQAGILAGAGPAIAPLRRHPLLRALRLDKLTLAALEATLHLHATRPEAIPALRMLGQTRATIRARAEALLGLLPSGIAELVDTDGAPGGGTLPDVAVPSAGLSFGEPEPLAKRLRAADPPIIGRIAADRLILDMLAVADAELPLVARALGQ